MFVSPSTLPVRPLPQNLLSRSELDRQFILCILLIKIPGPSRKLLPFKVGDYCFSIILPRRPLALDVRQHRRRVAEISPSGFQLFLSRRSVFPAGLAALDVDEPASSTRKELYLQQGTFSWLLQRPTGRPVFLCILAYPHSSVNSLTTHNQPSTYDRTHNQPTNLTTTE